jgi:hypothetical protein
MIPVGPSILVSDASLASSDYLTEGVDFFGRIVNCASDEMIGETTAFALVLSAMAHCVGCAIPDCATASARSRFLKSCAFTPPTRPP